MWPFQFVVIHEDCYRGEHIVEKQKRSYYLPGKLLNDFDKDAAKNGYVREKAVAAGVLRFLESNPNERAKLFERLDGLLRGAKK